MNSPKVRQMDNSAIIIEFIKVIGYGVAGYYFGQVKEKKNEKSVRFKNHQTSAVELIRTLMDDATRYHSSVMKTEERIAASTLLKVTLKKISTEANHVAMCAGKTSDFYLNEYEQLHSGVTAEPFENVQVTISTIDHIRVDQIANAGEALVTMIYHLKNN